MPVAALKNIAKKHGISLKKAEKKWDEAKAIVSKEYPEDSPAYWGTVMKITKNKIKKHSKKRKNESGENNWYQTETSDNWTCWSCERKNDRTDKECWYCGRKPHNESRIFDFKTFVNEGKKEKLEINKEIKKKNREDQLKSGAKLTTKVVPDKKKQYKRKKKVDLEDEK